MSLLNITLEQVLSRKRIAEGFARYADYPFEVGKFYDGGVVQRYIYALHGDEFDEDDRTADLFQCVRVKASSIEDSEWHVDDDVAASYADLKTDFPPIVLDVHGGILDGGHRLAAAKRRGEDTEITALKPVKKLPSGASVEKDERGP